MLGSIQILACVHQLPVLFVSQGPTVTTADVNVQEWQVISGCMEGCC
jgi:hypothetical protein